MGPLLPAVLATAGSAVDAASGRAPAPAGAPAPSVPSPPSSPAPAAGPPRPGAPVPASPAATSAAGKPTAADPAAEALLSAVGAGAPTAVSRLAAAAIPRRRSTAPSDALSLSAAFRTAPETRRFEARSRATAALLVAHAAAVLSCSGAADVPPTALTASCGALAGEALGSPRHSPAGALADAKTDAGPPPREGVSALERTATALPCLPPGDPTTAAEQLSRAAAEGELAAAEASRARRGATPRPAGEVGSTARGSSFVASASNLAVRTTTMGSRLVGEPTATEKMGGGESLEPTSATAPGSSAADALPPTPASEAAPRVGIPAACNVCVDAATPSFAPATRTPSSRVWDLSGRTAPAIPAWPPPPAFGAACPPALAEDAAALVATRLRASAPARTATGATTCAGAATSSRDRSADARLLPAGGARSSGARALILDVARGTSARATRPCGAVKACTVGEVTGRETSASAGPPMRVRTSSKPGISRGE
jgi:hypothetical protein